MAIVRLSVRSHDFPDGPDDVLAGKAGDPEQRDLLQLLPQLLPR